MQALIPFPEISPEIVSIPLFGMEFALRWYALAYIVGILIGWRIALWAVRRAPLWPAGQAPMDDKQVEDLLTWIILGIILGGRLGFVLFYDPARYLAEPLAVLRIWDGGMAFHGGLLGVIVGSWVFAGQQGINRRSMGDLLALAVPPGLFLGRVANFINAELWGRQTDLPWAMKFPVMCHDPVRQGCAAAGEWFYTGLEVPRHPSQLYQAGLEGLLLCAVLFWLVLGRGALKAPGRVMGVFLTGYGLARFTVEFVRQPDRQFAGPDNPLGYALQFGEAGLTMGQILSLPMIAIGLYFALSARRVA
ncbi:prolipoprotein diacylglyceryl transferase [Roseovarius faecimaris]|uniref:Phosphatidylglycerol--prolipoprotein diacylglyceryl transferase n=1 Tax=Roseovarius faecimaris TaxID=2494550 RepID=A0A6I6IKA4_9RHOB|nr:prolipoprotein diacylglyceryl transferase [Roseovarius faecimaris]QGX97420.1 prolipoprotein diacylglyceryl transferase [Roseovarius faecimaris]